MSIHSARVLQQEMDQRFDELRAIHDGSETCKTIADRWAQRKGKPLRSTHVQTCYSLVKGRLERGVDLHALAKEYSWSEIIWSLQPGTL